MFRAHVMLMTALAAAPAVARAASDLLATPAAPRAAPAMPPEAPLPPQLIRDLQCSMMDSLLEARLRQQGHTPRTIDMADQYFAHCAAGTPMSALAK